MKLRVIWVGRTRNPHLAAVVEDFANRSRHFVGLNIVELKEPRVADDKKRIAAESERILAGIEGADFVVALDAEGRTYSSTGFAKFIGKHMADNPRDLVFVVGGPAGLSDAVRGRADLTWSLSKLTFSHDLARAMLMEQLYRAFTILRNLPYAR